MWGSGESESCGGGGDVWGSTERGVEKCAGVWEDVGKSWGM